MGGGQVFGLRASVTSRASGHVGEADECPLDECHLRGTRRRPQGQVGLDDKVECGLEPPPRESRSWLCIGADGEFERIDMFDAHQREAGWRILRQLRCEEVTLLALDEEGSGHCSCGVCAGERVCCVTTFVQVCIWRVAAKPLVVMDFWPEAEGWARLVAQRVPTLPVATWGLDPLAAQIFDRPVVNLQREAGTRIHADLQLGSPHTERQLGLKAAYAWVAHRRGELIPVYLKPKSVHVQQGCWQRRHRDRLLTEEHKQYAAADAYATGALFNEYLRLQAEQGTATGVHGPRRPRSPANTPRLHTVPGEA